MSLLEDSLLHHYIYKGKLKSIPSMAERTVRCGPDQKTESNGLVRCFLAPIFFKYHIISWILERIVEVGTNLWSTSQTDGPRIPDLNPKT